MNSDWSLLVRVRERQRDATVAALRRAMQAQARAQDVLTQAESAHGSRIDQRLQHVLQSRQQAADGLSTVASMRTAAGWMHALEAQITQAAKVVEESLSAVEAEQEAVRAARKAWTASCAALEKALAMRKRELATSSRRAEVRQEERAEEASAQTWLLHRDADMPKSGTSADAK